MSKTTPLLPNSIGLLKFIFGPEWENAWICWTGNMRGCRVKDLPSTLPDSDIYFSVGMLKAGAQDRHLDQVESVRALVIDDVGTKIDKDAFKLMAPAPNWMIETSRGNYHCGYLIDMEPDAYTALRRGMKASPVWGHSDGIDTVRLFRLPQGRNSKNGFQVKLVSVENLKMDLAVFFQGSAGASGAGAPPGVPDTIETEALLQALVDLIPNDGLDREEWVSMAHAIWGAAQDFDGFPVFASWAARWSAGADDPDANQLLWDGITSSSIGRGWLLRMAGALAATWAPVEAAAVFDDGVDVEAAAGPAPDCDNAVQALQRDVANLIVRTHGHGLRYNVSTGLWHKFEGTWKESPYSLGFRLAKQWADHNAPLLGKVSRAAVSKASFYEGVEKLLKAEPSIAVVKTDFDQDDWLLGTPGGTVELRTGVLRAPVSAEMISLSTSCIPAEKEDCPKWLWFVNWACTDPKTKKVDLGLLKSLKQWLGYCLCGDVAKEMVFFLHGEGKNGKGTVIETVQWIMGDYFHMATKDLFMETKFGTHTEETAALAGKRMVAADEVPTNARWNESLLKAVSGGGTMSSRHLFARVFTFPIKFKVTIVGNAKPSFQGEINDALKRRLHLAGFINKADPVDDTLKAVLRSEAPGVLRWMLNGLVDMLSGPGGKLFIADSMIAATEGYFNENDLLAQWLAECTEKIVGAETPSSEAFRCWQEWRNAAGNHYMVDTAMAFRPAMEKRGFIWRVTKKGKVIMDLRLKKTVGVF